MIMVFRHNHKQELQKNMAGNKKTFYISLVISKFFLIVRLRVTKQPLFLFYFFFASVTVSIKVLQVNIESIILS